MAKKIDFHNEFVNHKANLQWARDKVKEGWGNLNDAAKQTWADNSLYKDKKDDGSAFFLDYLLRSFATNNTSALLKSITLNLNDTTYDERAAATWTIT